jgi:hypothetical protein
MRKWVVMGLIGVLALLPAAAFADVDIDVDIHKRKTKLVFEKLVKFKQAVIVAVVVLVTDDAAESETLVNQTNTRNFELDFFANSQSFGIVSGNSGITGVNLASGNMNNQANAVSVAATASDDFFFFDKGAFAESQAASDQKNAANAVKNVQSISFSSLTASGNSGITGVNQASGHMNNQANAVSVATSTDRGLFFNNGGVALSEADLGQVNAFNRVFNFGGVSIASASVSTNSGITGVNQSSGHMNNQSNVVSVAATN